MASPLSELHIVHLNDAYELESGNGLADSLPVGGAARFASVVDACRAVASARGGHSLVVSSGDHFSPSLLSVVTRGRHMVPVLVGLGVDASCVGNHELDIGVSQAAGLMVASRFPWVLSNLRDVHTLRPLCDAQESCVITVGPWRVGIIGLVEDAWVDTLATVSPTDLLWEEPVPVALRLARHLKEQQGAHIVLALTHMRVVNDIALRAGLRDAELGGSGVRWVDAILGGHDHDIAHRFDVEGGAPIIKSGSDFRYVTRAIVTPHNMAPTWTPLAPASPLHMSAAAAAAPVRHVGAQPAIVASDSLSSTFSISADLFTVSRGVHPQPAMSIIVAGFLTMLESKMKKMVGLSRVPLDARFSSVRTRETNVGNLMSDLMRRSVDADIAFLNSGTLRADTIIGPGVLRLRDLVSLLPFFGDTVVKIATPGSTIISALENSVSKWPAREGRFCQVSGLKFAFDPSRPPGERVLRESILVLTSRRQHRHSQQLQHTTSGGGSVASDSAAAVTLGSGGGAGAFLVHGSPVAATRSVGSFDVRHASAPAVVSQQEQQHPLPPLSIHHHVGGDDAALSQPSPSTASDVRRGGGGDDEEEGDEEDSDAGGIVRDMNDIRISEEDGLEGGVTLEGIEAESGTGSSSSQPLVIPPTVSRVVLASSSSPSSSSSLPSTPLHHPQHPHPHSLATTPSRPLSLLQHSSHVSLRDHHHPTSYAPVPGASISHPHLLRTHSLPQELDHISTAHSLTGLTPNAEEGEGGGSVTDAHHATGVVSTAHVVGAASSIARGGGGVSRSTSAWEPLDPATIYTVALKNYMLLGKDGFSCLDPLANPDTVRVLIDESSGPVLPSLLRTHFKVLSSYSTVTNAVAAPPPSAVAAPPLSYSGGGASSSPHVASTTNAVLSSALSSPSPKVGGGGVSSPNLRGVGVGGGSGINTAAVDAGILGLASCSRLAPRVNDIVRLALPPPPRIHASPLEGGGGEGMLHLAAVGEEEESGDEEEEEEEEEKGGGKGSAIVGARGGADEEEGMRGVDTTTTPTSSTLAFSGARLTDRCSLVRAGVSAADQFAEGEGVKEGRGGDEAHAPPSSAAIAQGGALTPDGGGGGAAATPSTSSASLLARDLPHRGGGGNYSPRSGSSVIGAPLALAAVRIPLSQAAHNQEQPQIGRDTSEAIGGGSGGGGSAGIVGVAWSPLEPEYVSLTAIPFVAQRVHETIDAIVASAHSTVATAATTSAPVVVQAPQRSAPRGSQSAILPSRVQSRLVGGGRQDWGDAAVPSGTKPSTASRVDSFLDSSISPRSDADSVSPGVESAAGLPVPALSSPASPHAPPALQPPRHRLAPNTVGKPGGTLAPPRYALAIAPRLEGRIRIVGHEHDGPDGEGLELLSAAARAQAQLIEAASGL